MAGDPATVAAFTGKIRDLAQPGLAKDLESLRAAKRKHLLDMQQRGYGPGGDSAALLAQSSDLVGGGGGGGAFEDDPETIHAWDTNFYHNRVLKEVRRRDICSAKREREREREREKREKRKKKGRNICIDVYIREKQLTFYPYLFHTRFDKKRIHLAFRLTHSFIFSFVDLTG